jgi:hypothetical protein
MRDGDAADAGEGLVGYADEISRAIREGHLREVLPDERELFRKIFGQDPNECGEVGS